MKKIDIEKSTVYTRDRNEDLSQCVLLLGKKGYFSDHEDFSTYQYGTLTEVRCWLNSCTLPFVLKDDEGEWNSFRYFIPEESVVFKKQEPKYRLYEDVAEFANSVGLRDSDKVQFLRIRSKNGNYQCYLAYNGYEIDTFGTVHIHLGAIAFTFNELFNSYEYTLDSIEWKPFGVLNEEDY